MIVILSPAERGEGSPNRWAFYPAKGFFARPENRDSLRMTANVISRESRAQIWIGEVFYTGRPKTIPINSGGLLRSGVPDRLSFAGLAMTIIRFLDFLYTPRFYGLP
jgi:hypothetical protein